MKLKFVLSVFAAAVTSSLSAADFVEYTVKSDLAGTVVDWTADATYVGDAAPSDFSTAKVLVPVAVKVDATTFSGFAAIKWVYLSAKASALEIDTGNGDCSFPGAITGLAGCGALTKIGTGTLRLTSNGRISSTSDYYNYDYHLDYHVAAGTLCFPVSNAKTTMKSRTKSMVLDEGAVFVVSKNVATTVDGVFAGTGTVTAPDGAASSSTHFVPTYDGSEPIVFDGRIDGAVRLYTCANLILTNENSTAAGIPILYNYGTSDRALGVTKFGKAGSPSPLGTSGTISLQQFGGHLRYLGEGPEVCDKAFTVGHDSASTSSGVRGVIDGGAYGGLELSGSVGVSSSYALMQRLELTGSNRNECVLSGTSAIGSKSGGYGRIHVAKTGTGTWHFTHNGSRDGISGVTVTDGILAFDTLNEVGEACSFGTGLLNGEVSFYPDVCEAYDAANRVPWEFTLGVASSEAVGTLALGSPTGCVSTTRPVSIAGRGRFLNDNETAPMRIAGVMPRPGDAAKTLVLDGSSTADNTVMDVTNDVEGVLSVVKNGTGRWILAGNQEFKGDLTVNRGELVVKNPTANPQFTYFRVILKENWAELPNCARVDSWAKNVFALYGLRLYDAAGNARNLTSDTYSYDYASMGVGQVAYHDAARRDLTYKGYKPNKLSACSSSYQWVGGLTRPYASKPETWVKVDFRVAPGEDVVAMDFYPRFGWSESGTTAAGSQRWNFGANVKIFNVEGSTDGMVWEQLFDTDVQTVSNDWSCATWYYGDNHSEGAAKGLKFDRTASSRALPSVLKDVGKISVGAGAALRIEGAPLSIGALAVDSQSGGIVSNVAFATTGTLSVKNMTDDADIALPGTYQDVSGFDNIAENWTLDAGPKSGRYVIVNRNGVLHLVKRGMFLLIR